MDNIFIQKDIFQFGRHFSIILLIIIIPWFSSLGQATKKTIAKTKNYNSKIQNITLDSLASIENKEVYSTKTGTNHWILKEKMKGVEIYSKWYEVDHFIVLKIKNTTNFKTIVTFKPIFKCTNIIESGNQSIKHIYINPLRTMNIYLEVKCDNNFDTDLVLENIAISKK